MSVFYEFEFRRSNGILSGDLRAAGAPHAIPGEEEPAGHGRRTGSRRNIVRALARKGPQAGLRLVKAPFREGPGGA